MPQDDAIVRLARQIDSAGKAERFLVNADEVARLLCVAGGLTGLALGVGAAYALEQYKEWETVITPWSVSLAVAFSLLVGLFFGFYPAWRASRLDPIDALRFE